MNAFTRVLLMAGGLAVAACGPSATPARPAAIELAQPAEAPKGRLTIALGREPDQFGFRFGETSRTAEWNWILDSPLTYYDMQNLLQPMTTRQVPTQDNRDWVVDADGTMVTTYRLRENLRWHDGVALTAHDFVFAFEVYMDPDVLLSSRDPLHLIGR